jgi:hypothetical protein
MPGLKVGEKIKVHHTDGDFRYILDVEVTAICSLNEFKGRVEKVFSNSGDRGEITGGHILALRGQERTFKNEDIAAR